MPVIEFKNVSYTYPGDELKSLDHVSLAIEKGSFTAVLGRNGSGKSTFAKHINGILVPDEGDVIVNGCNTKDENNALLIRSHVGMVFQNPDNQIVNNVVEDDVAFAPENLGIPSEEIRARVDAALKQVGMYEYRQHAPHLLSGGQKQRIAIAGVLAMEPDIIVLDEPTAMLDPVGRADVIGIVTDLCRKKGMTVVIITHHMEECIGADRLVIMENGYIKSDSTPEEAFYDIDFMKSCGLDAPETANVINDLRRHGLNISNPALDAASCAKAIKEILEQ